jgi:hypothetical protein
MKRFAAVALAILVWLGPLSAAAAGRQDPHWSMKALDIAIARPVSLAVSSVSTGLFFGTLPLTFLIGVGDESTYVLLFAPWRYTAARYVGDFAEYKDGRTIFGTVKR